MASNILSRLLPSAIEDPPDGFSPDYSDHQRATPLAVDEENLSQQFQDQDLDQLLEDAAQNEDETENTAFPVEKRVTRQLVGDEPLLPEQKAHARLEQDDDVPQSLLLDPDRRRNAPTTSKPFKTSAARSSFLPPPVPGPSFQGSTMRGRPPRNRETNELPRSAHSQPGEHPRHGWSAFITADPRQKALWRWANVQNLDHFLSDVYSYYLERGIFSILLSRLINLLTIGFVVSLITFLTVCVSYKDIPHKKTLRDVTIPHCTQRMSGLPSFILWLISLVWLYKLLQYILDIRRLWILHDFYHYLLDIPDRDLQTVSWQMVIARLMALRDLNPVTAQNLSETNRQFIGHQSRQRMDAHDIANRIMRRENYLIALLNKDVLDLTLPLPFIKNRQFFSKAVEWNIHQCIIDYVFNERGQINTLFLKDKHRRVLIDGLHLRFRVAAVMSIVTAPVMVVGMFALYFLRYFMEFKMNPGQLGSRAFTPLAEWKFREFNELWHLFDRRTNLAHPYATRYLEQFPKDKTYKIYRFVAFVAGALAAVLFIFTLFDTEDFLGFEITPNRTALFYIGILGTIHVAARGAVPESNFVHDPEFALQNVIELTHYCPASWKGRLHTEEIRQEFSEFYQLKALTFLEEIMSLLYTPILLWFSLPRCSAQVVDFFREFTIHVDGLGHVCSFAVFDFQRGVENIARPQVGRRKGENLREDYFSSKDGKLLASYYGFLDAYATKAEKGGNLRAYPKRSVNPPMALPGVASTQLGAETGPLTSRTALGRPSLYRIDSNTSERPPLMSPIQSVLLDPHHQPAHLRNNNAADRIQASDFDAGRLASTTGDSASLQGPLEAPEENEASARAFQVEDESSMGDSWRTSRAAQLDSEVDDGDGPVEHRGAGVLGLIYQLQKAQTDGKVAGGVSI